MAYQALYRKWRPASFDDVKGQDHIVTALRNQIRMNRIGHAYLFCGTRGTGKTSVAKIFAKAVNCQHPVDGSPCNECDMCRAVNEQRSMNVIEIDAASNNGVDNIREIRDEVAFSPAEGRYKVYIIDEVHMLSKGAFNALLKTLEEPPEYVIFILATTEPFRIPVTILSRCQRYDFHRITVRVITDRLRELADAEGIQAQDQALEYIARMGDGSMRDALSLLDQCVSFYIGQELTYENVLKVLGAVDMSVFSTVFRCIAEGDAARALDELDGAIAGGGDVIQFTRDLTMYFRNVLMVQCGDDDLAAAYVSAGQLAALRDDSQLVDTQSLMRCIRVLSELEEKLRLSTQKRVTLEVALVKLCRPAMETDISSLLQRIGMLEKKVAALDSAAAQGRLVVQSAEVSGASSSEERAEIKASGQQKRPAGQKTEDRDPEGNEAGSTADGVRRLIDNWYSAFGDASAPAQVTLRKTHPQAGEGSQITVICDDDMTYKYWNKHLQELDRIAGDFAGTEIDLKIKQEMPQGGGPEFDPVDLFNTDGVDIVDED